jgi:hypothetical protein
MTERVIDQHTAVPGHDEMAPMAAGLIHAYLAGDPVTAAAITLELEDMAISTGEMATTLGVIAAKMLVEACGTRVLATALAAQVSGNIATREIRVAFARQAGV